MSYNNLASTSKTLSNVIWNSIKDDKDLNQVVKNIEQISFASPNETEKTAQLSVFLYNPTELPAMRNQPPKANEPQTLVYLKLHYLITPLTRNPLTDQALLGKIIRIFEEKPVVRGNDLKDGLADTQYELRVALETQSIGEQNSIWTMLQTPYRLSVSYGVYPLEIKNDAPRPKIISGKNAALGASAVAKLA